MGLESGSENNQLDNSVTDASLTLSEDTTTPAATPLDTTGGSSSRTSSILDPIDGTPFQIVGAETPELKLAFGGDPPGTPREPDDRTPAPPSRPGDTPAAPADPGRTTAAEATSEQQAINRYFASEFFMGRNSVDTNRDQKLTKEELEAVTKDPAAAGVRKEMAQFMLDNFDAIKDLANIGRRVENPPNIDVRDWAELMRRYQYQRSGGQVPVQRNGEDLSTPAVRAPLNSIFRNLPAATPPGGRPPSTQPERPPTPPRR
ncbi:MAG: hypothetical protein K2Z81_08035 [Cyanobacteria bacterium]|nr:hypothetical protein [Cyanobacteriota bacterium]